MSRRLLIALAAALALFASRGAASGDDTPDDGRLYPPTDAAPELVQLSPEEKRIATRELKRVEKRSKKFDIFLNRDKMEKMKGDRLAKVLAAYDRFISVLEELPEEFVKACRIRSVWFSDEIVDMSGNHAGGFAAGEGINLSMNFRRSTVYHEMFHKFECCITPAEAREWEECNPDEFIYEGSAWDAFSDNTRESKKARERYLKRLAAGKEKSAREKRDEARTKKDARRIAANATNNVVQAAFIGSYAQTTPLEDRACTFGAMMSEGPRFIERVRRSEHMRKKWEWMLRKTGKDKFLGRDFWEERSEVSTWRLDEGELSPADAAARARPGSPEELAEIAGYDTAKLKLIARAIDRYNLATSAMVVMVDGKTVFEYGDTSRAEDVSLCWPSLLSILYGRYVQTKKINLDETLETLGVGDTGGLQPRERKATVRDLVLSRSACFHPASNEPAKAVERERGSYLPGGRFFYNNWDFNVAASIFELKTRRSVFDAFDTDIAQPLNLKDWRRDAQHMTGDASVSEHRACAFSLSARDMASLGELMRCKGRWKGLQVVPAKWVEESTQRISRFPQGGGFGYMWWIENEVREPRVFKGAFSARGLQGQRITVVPELNMVVAHLAGRSGRRPVKSADYNRLVFLAVSARK